MATQAQPTKARLSSTVLFAQRQSYIFRPRGTRGSTLINRVGYQELDCFRSFIESCWVVAKQIHQKICTFLQHPHLRYRGPHSPPASTGATRVCTFRVHMHVRHTRRAFTVSCLSSRNCDRPQIMMCLTVASHPPAHEGQARAVQVDVDEAVRKHLPAFQEEALHDAIQA